MISRRPRSPFWIALAFGAVGCGAPQANAVTESTAVLPSSDASAPAVTPASVSLLDGSVHPQSEVASNPSAGGAGTIAAIPPRSLTRTQVALPGVEGPAFLDYVAFDPTNARVWVPVGNSGSVDVFDITSPGFTRVDGFRTAAREVRGKKRIMGPSAATVGDGVVYVGNRASSEVCPVDAKTLQVAACLQLPSPTDGVAYVPSVKEVWVTTPQERALVILDASNPRVLKRKTTVKTEGAPEGYATDIAHGLFFTNLEDAGATVVIDVKTHKVTATWGAGCGPDGPRGLAFDAIHDFLVVACTDHLQVLDAAHDGARLGKLDTGDGVDNIDIVGDVVYAAAGKASRLTVAAIDDKGQYSVVATAPTSEGARNAVADGRGHVYVPDGPGARLFVFSGAPSSD